jgi:kynurenine formamidase
LNADYRLWGLLAQLRAARFVDLTQSFRPGIPHPAGLPDEERTTLFDHENDGFRTHLYSHVGQWGTHVDPPVHFVRGGRHLDEISVAEMILPLVVLDISRIALTDPDYELRVDDILAWEDRYGRVPAGAFAALRTDWSKRWPDPVAMANRDRAGLAHWPGWSVPALRFLCEERDITACGHETTDTDAGYVVTRLEWPAETFLLQQDRYQIELMANLDEVAPAGAVIVASFPKAEKGSGFPARAFAITP